MDKYVARQAISFSETGIFAPGSPVPATAEVEDWYARTGGYKNGLLFLENLEPNPISRAVARPEHQCYYPDCENKRKTYHAYCDKHEA